MKYIFLLICCFFISIAVCAEDTKIVSWFSQSAIDVKTKRKFEAKFKIKLGDMWKNDKPEILIKTLDSDECILQISNIVPLANMENDVELLVLGLKDFKDYRLCLRTKNKIEYFRQTFAKRDKEPAREEINLEDGTPNVVFYKKMEAGQVGKSVSECKLTGIVMNIGASQAKMVKVKATISDGLGEKIKDFEFLLEQDKKPIIMDGGDKFKIERIEGGVKGWAGGTFGLTWDGGNDKEVHVDSGIVGAKESVFEFGKTEGDVSVTKIVVKTVNTNELNGKITIFNSMKKPILNPVVTVKLLNDKGELIQPIILDFEGELAGNEEFEFPFVHKNAPPFNGIGQSIKYSTKN